MVERVSTFGLSRQQHRHRAGGHFGAVAGQRAAWPPRPWTPWSAVQSGLSTVSERLDSAKTRQTDALGLLDRVSSYRTQLEASYSVLQGQRPQPDQ